jgi:hypothetical protein
MSISALTAPTETAADTERGFQLLPFPADLLEFARKHDVDAQGLPIARVTAGGGEPLRCCLRNAQPGDSCLLFNYEPVLPGDGSPYREIGAVYVHAETCSGPSDLTAYPSEWIGRPQILRAYDDRGWIHPASREHDGSNPARELAEVLAEEGVVLVHSRNIVYGCFNFAAVAAPR